MRHTRFMVGVFAASLLGGAALPVRAATDSLEKSMGAMQKDFKALKKQVADKTQNDSSLALLNDFEKNVVICKGLLPEKVEMMTGDDKAKATGEYRAMMFKLLTQLVKAEGEVADGKNDEALATVSGLVEIEKAGHAEFRPKD